MPTKEELLNDINLIITVSAKQDKDKLNGGNKLDALVDYYGNKLYDIGEEYVLTAAEQKIKPQYYGKLNAEYGELYKAIMNEYSMIYNEIY